MNTGKRTALRQKSQGDLAAGRDHEAADRLPGKRGMAPLRFRIQMRPQFGITFPTSRTSSDENFPERKSGVS
jgi:hypothetical protein